MLRERGLDMGEEWERSETGLFVPPRPTPPALQHGQPVAIGLFAGCGGMDCGVSQAGFHVAAASESDPTAAITYLMNLGHYPCDIRFVEETDEAAFEKAVRRAWGLKRKTEEYPDHVPFVAGSGWIRSQPDVYGCELFWLGDVRKLKGSDFLEPLGLDVGEVDLICGGPPCQGFSTVGKRNVMDPRNSLVFEFTRLVAEIRPKALMFENVPGIISMVTPEGIPVVDAIAMDLEGRGYGTRDALARALQVSSGAGVAARAKPPDRDDPPEEEEDDAQLSLDEALA